MLKEERYSFIINLLNEKDAVTVTELTDVLGASEATVRRDLYSLAKEGKVHKVFGGATSVSRTGGVEEVQVSSRETFMRTEKEMIGKYAAGLIEDDDFVYIDAGTTTAFLCNHITNEKASYITNCVPHAHRLLSKGLTVYLIGGKIKNVTEAIVGAESIRSIANYNFSKAFMGTNGIEAKTGFTTPETEEACIKEAVVNRSFRTFILADHTKFNKILPVTFARPESCTIITDQMPKSTAYRKFSIREVVQ